MTLPEIASAFLLLVLLALAVGLVAALAGSRQGPAARALGEGDLRTALAAGRGAHSRDERLAAAVAARQLLDFDAAVALLDALVAEEPDDGEAWLERGVTAAWVGDAATAERAFGRVATRRSDLGETLSLHRAWLALRAGERERARRLFGEIAWPLHNKLTMDLGPGDPSFAEWFLMAAVLHHTLGQEEEARQALEHGVAAAPDLGLVELLTSPVPELQEIALSLAREDKKI